jgi:hypothetical protein
VGFSCAQETFEYYEEYQGNLKTNYTSFFTGAAVPVGGYSSKSFTATGFTIGMMKGRPPLDIGNRIFGARNLKLGYQHGFVGTLNRIDVKKLNEKYDLSLTDTSRNAYWAYGFGLKMMRPFSEKAFFEVNATVYAGFFMPGQRFNFYYTASSGEEVLIESEVGKPQILAYPSIGLLYRFGPIGLGLNYDWFEFFANHTVYETKSGRSYSFSRRAYVQNLRITASYILFK